MYQFECSQEYSRAEICPQTIIRVLYRFLKEQTEKDLSYIKVEKEQYGSSSLY